MTGFSGFSDAALDFYDDLETDNTKSFWAANKAVYEDAVKAPMVALLAALEDEFGASKVFRPYRDVRFAKDKTPYKTHQGGFVAAGPASGWYVQVSAPGVLVSAGFYGATAERLAWYRDAVVDERRGKELERLLANLMATSWQIGGDRVKTTPRGYAADHPRISLLRHKSLTVTKNYGFGSAICTPRLLDRVRSDWREARPLIEWLRSA